MHFPSFSSMGFDVLSYSQNEVSKRKLSSFTRMQTQLKGFGNILDIKDNQPLICLVIAS